MALILPRRRQRPMLPSHDTLAADAGLSNRGVRNLIPKLVDAGQISIERRSVQGRSTSNLYTLHLLPPGGHDVPGGGNHVPDGVAPDAPSGWDDVPGEVAFCGDLPILICP